MKKNIFQTANRVGVRSFAHKPLSNPLRRWVWHRAITGACLLFPSSVAYSYITSSYAQPPESLASPMIVSLVYLAPLNLLSRIFGQIVSSEKIPRWVHRKSIQFYAYVYDIDPKEATGEYPTLQHFFTRKRDVPISTSDTNLVAISPCEGELLRIIPLGESNDSIIEQVKGCTFRLSNFLQSELSPVKPQNQRVCFVFHIRPGDYHWFHAPMDFRIKKSIQIPGSLLPVTSTALQWLPRLLVSNERVIMQGEDCTMAAVGATNVGSIRLNYDQRVKTNYVDARTHAIHYNYEKKDIMQKKVNALDVLNSGRVLYYLLMY